MRRVEKVLSDENCELDACYLQSRSRVMEVELDAPAKLTCLVVLSRIEIVNSRAHSIACSAAMEITCAYRLAGSLVGRQKCACI